MTERKSYAEKFATTRKVIEDLLEASPKPQGLLVRDVRRYLHGSTGEALIAPILAQMEAEGLIESILDIKGGVVYTTEKWNNRNKEESCS